VKQNAVFENESKIAPDSAKVQNLKFSVRILSQLQAIFDHPGGLLQFVLVPSHEHFCVYVAEKYVRMKIPEYGLELNIMDITQKENLNKEVVLQCRHSYTGALSDEASKEHEIFSDIELRDADKGAHGAPQDSIGDDVEEQYAKVHARAEPALPKDVNVLQTTLQEKTNQQENASSQLAIIRTQIERVKQEVKERETVRDLPENSKQQKAELKNALQKLRVGSIAQLSAQLDTRKKAIAELEGAANAKQAEIEAMKTAIAELCAEIVSAQQAQAQATGAAPEQMKQALDHAKLRLKSMNKLVSVQKQLMAAGAPRKWVIAVSTFQADSTEKTMIHDKSLGVVLQIDNVGIANPR
jgi:chromosome segregation ATPase